MIKFTDKAFQSIYEINNNYLQQKDFKRLGEFLRNYKFYNIFVEETPPSELSLTNKDFPQMPSLSALPTYQILPLSNTNTTACLFILRPFFQYFHKRYSLHCI